MPQRPTEDIYSVASWVLMCTVYVLGVAAVFHYIATVHSSCETELLVEDELAAQISIRHQYTSFGLWVWQEVVQIWRTHRHHCLDKADQSIFSLAWFEMLFSSPWLAKDCPPLTTK